jgi:hypothetical protein
MNLTKEQRINKHITVAVMYSNQQQAAFEARNAMQKLLNCCETTTAQHNSLVAAMLAADQIAAANSHEKCLQRLLQTE